MCVVQTTVRSEQNIFDDINYYGIHYMITIIIYYNIPLQVGTGTVYCTGTFP
jgi:hypothetical protein